MSYIVRSKRFQTQTDKGVEATTPEEAASLVARQTSNAPDVSHVLGHFFEAEVFDEEGSLLGNFEFDEKHNVVKPPESRTPAPAKIEHARVEPKIELPKDEADVLVIRSLKPKAESNVEEAPKPEPRAEVKKKDE